MKNRRLGVLYEKLKKHPLRRMLDPLLPDKARQAIAQARDQNLEEPPPMPAALQQRLNAFYHDDIAALEALLHRDLSAWKR